MLVTLVTVTTQIMPTERHSSTSSEFRFASSISLTLSAPDTLPPAFVPHPNSTGVVAEERGKSPLSCDNFSEDEKRHQE